MKWQVRFLFAFLVSIVAACVPVYAHAATWYANSSTGNDTSGTGASGAPYATFHKAYTAASAGDTINLTGTFDWTNSGESGDAQYTGYTITKNLTITGQAADETFIQAAANASSGDRKVFTIDGATVTVSNVTIRYGRNTTSSSGTSGGGIYVTSDGVLTAEDCRITENYVTSTSWGGFGGGINNEGTLTVNRCTIDNNFAYSQGGGVNNAYVAAGSNTARITNSTIAFNSTAATVATVGGAGLYLRSGTVHVTNTTIAYNDAPSGTGDTTGIDIVSGATAVIKNSIVTDNEVGGADVSDSSGNWFDITNSGTLTDNGGNIFGKVSTSFSGVSFNATSWYDLYSNGAGDDVYRLSSNANTTGSIHLSTSLADNSTENGTQTLAISSASSVAVDNGSTAANGSVSIPSTDQRGLSRSGSTDIGSYEYGALPSDSTAPVISSVASSTTATTATITWTTDEAASTLVRFGVMVGLGTTTSHTNTVTRVTSHSITLSSLKSCAKYYFEVQSVDASSNTATSSATLRTTGCSGSAPITATQEGTIAAASGGTLSQGTLTLAVPVSFTSATTSAVFQAQTLSSDSFFSAVGAPSGKSRIGSSVYSLSAFSDATTTVSSFDTALSMTLSYEDTDVTGYDETSLKIHRYDGSDWYELSSCAVDRSANTVTCTTTSFSDFSLFGTANSASSASGGSVQDQVKNLVTMGKNEEAQKIKKEWPGLFGQSTTTKSNTPPGPSPVASVPIMTVRDLSLGLSGEDVMSLQKMLIEKASGPSSFELARIGATGYFGVYTRNALGEYQKVSGIRPFSGYFGSLTRAHMKHTGTAGVWW